VDANGTRDRVRRDAGDRAAPAPADGASLFVRYAYPPNELGHCGPGDSRALFEYGSRGPVDAGLTLLARGFAGAWPYLELIAGATGIADPLDRRVVEAYWVGNRLLERVDMALFGNSLLERFRRRAGSSWGHLAEHVPEGAVPHHSFHVFGVYPWVGLLGADRGPTPLYVLDRCRIRWGRVRAVRGDQAVVRSRPLGWDGHALSLDPPVEETVTRAIEGVGFIADLRPGDWVSMHWGWLCDRLTPRQLAALRRYTAWQLDITNHRVAHPGPRAALG
jgi:hypothetical protein